MKQPTAQNTHPNEPLFPISLYIYDDDGHYGDPLIIRSEAQLNGPGIKMVLQVEMEQGHEIRMTDPDDRLVFHAQEGKVIFPRSGQ